jgi:hypothetical protein
MFTAMQLNLQYLYYVRRSVTFKCGFACRIAAVNRSFEQATYLSKGAAADGLLFRCEI